MLLYYLSNAQICTHVQAINTRYAEHWSIKARHFVADEKGNKNAN